jgi:hypothetical protein
MGKPHPLPLHHHHHHHDGHDANEKTIYLLLPHDENEDQRFSSPTQSKMNGRELVFFGG